MAKNSGFGVFQNLLDLFLVQDLLCKEALHTKFEQCETVFSRRLQITLILFREKIKCLPEHLKNVADFIVIRDAEIAFDENERVQNEVSDPFELICLEASLVIVPRMPVFITDFLVVFDVLQDKLLCGLIWVFRLPKLVKVVRSDHV